MSQIITTRDLLHKVLDYYCFWKETGSRVNEYYPKEIENNESTYYRIKQLYILFDALEIFPVKIDDILKDNNKSPLERFIEGDFLEGRKLEENNEGLVKDILEKGKELILKEIPKFQFEERDYRPLSVIGNLFYSLMRYRLKVHPFTKGYYGITLGVSFGSYYANYLEDVMGKKLEPLFLEIDNIISLLIDPFQKQITIQELKEKYDYPDIDFTQFDKDYYMDNI